MSSPPQIEILDLRHFTGRQLRTILEQEATLWEERLRWNYTQSTELLIQYLDSQILPGFVAMLCGRICGFCFCVYEGAKAVIGDIFVAPGEPSRLAIAQTLTRHLLEVLEASPDIDRIESQLLLYDSGVLTPAFRPSGFEVFPRLFLECDLAGKGRETSLPVNFPAAIELCRWIPSFYHPSAELIHAAYDGHLDSQINDQYRTLHGSLRFLHNIVRFPGCGTFDPESSWVLRERGVAGLIGVLLCSTVAPGVAHVTQLCIAGTHRGAGLGSMLLAHCMDRLRRKGFHGLTLTVSEANLPALALYQRAGFTTRLRFEALVLDKTLAAERFRVNPPAGAVTPGDSGRSLKPEPRGAEAGPFSFARRRATSGSR